MFRDHLKQTRDDDSHARDVSTARRTLADGIVAHLHECLSQAYHSGTRLALTRALEQFRDPRSGVGVSSDFIQHIWDERQDLHLSDDDIILLVTSELANGTNPRRWFEHRGLDESLVAGVLATDIAHLTWSLSGRVKLRRQGASRATLAHALRTMNAAGAAACFRAALEIAPTLLSPQHEVEGYERTCRALGTFAIWYVLDAVAMSALTGCCSGGSACKKVSGWEQEPADGSPRLIITSGTRVCHAVLRGEEDRPLSTCRLAYMREAPDLPPDDFIESLEQHLEPLSIVLQALDSRDSGTGVGLVRWIEAASTPSLTMR